MTSYNAKFFPDDLLSQIRQRFAHIDRCPEQGERIFFENAGGALTLNSVVETSRAYAAIPDNQGRDNPASHKLVEVIKTAKSNMAEFMNTSSGQFVVGESGTELLFRLISAACLGTKEGGRVLGSTLEHPASRSAAARWSKIARQTHHLIAHDNETGSVDAAAYRAAITPDTRVATIVHTSPVTGIGVDIAEIAAEIRAVAPDCFIIVDGIQHAPHGEIDIDGTAVSKALGCPAIDGYVISPYKMFSRHGYGFAWLSDRLSALPHDCLLNGPENNWELGTRDTGAYATLNDVVDYFAWLGEICLTNQHLTALGANKPSRKEMFRAASTAIRAHEAALTNSMIHGVGNLSGLAELERVQVIGGDENPHREGLVSLAVDGVDSAEIVSSLNSQGIRTHIRKADHYSSNILTPLGLASCVRVSICHYNSADEISKFLAAMREIAS